MKNHNQSNANRGGALLSVIIAMTVVGILAAVVLSISYTNFRMKQIDKQSKNNFYSAEAVLDEIVVGLQNEVSAQYKKAYTTVMENYGYYTSTAEMKTDFNTEFVLSMVEALQEDTDQEHYKFQKILDYVDPLNHPMSSYTITSKSINVYGQDGAIVGVAPGNLLETLTDGLVLRNLEVTYTYQGYVNTITTDIKINTPALEFARISTMPEINDYCLIAQDGLTSQTGTGWTLKGKAFAGTGIDLLNGAALYANDPSALLLVTQGEVSLTSGAMLETGTTNSLWAKSIIAKADRNSNNEAKNTLSLLGRCYVQDDTTLSGSGNELRLGGQYFGYSGNDSSHEDSSAIIINGVDSVLDMSELKSLVLAGTAFISTPSTDVNDLGRLTGESIAVKGNQIAYLLPTECEGITTNPMSDTQFEALGPGDAWKEKALRTILPGLNRSLASYGLTKDNIMRIRTQRAGGTNYIYLNFEDSDTASEYFMDYYGTDAGKKVKEYLDRYVLNFSFNTDGVSRLVTQGNYLIPDEDKADKADYKGNVTNASSATQELLSYRYSFNALCHKLVENQSSLSSLELQQTVYQNLIDQKTDGSGKMDEFLLACKNNNNGISPKWSANMTYSMAYGYPVITICGNAADLNNLNAVRCIVVDNAGKGAYPVPSGGKGIIIATGDVDISGPAFTAWNGLIIANGKATLYNGSKQSPLALQADVEAVSQAMQFICSVGAEEVAADTPDCNYAVINLFNGGSEFTVGASSDDDGAKVDVRECVSFENWTTE